MHVVVLGAGYAGLTLTKDLEKRLPAEADIELIDESGTHVVQHELHRLIRRPGLASDLEFSLEDVLDSARVTQAHVAALDAEGQTVTLDDGREVEYDVGAVCLGGDAAFYGLPGLSEYATPLKRIEDARQIREAVLPVIEAGGRIVVGGAGLSGVQVAGELAEMRAGADADAELVVLEQRDTVAPNFDEQFQTAVRTELERRGVTIRTNAAIEAAGSDEVRLADGDAVPYDELVWTGGIRGDDALGGDRPKVRSDLLLTGSTFGLGDAVRVVDDHGEAVPASARTAMAQAHVVAVNIQRTVEAGAAGGAQSFTPRFDRYRAGQPRWLVTIGDGAVAQIGQTVVSGPPAIALKTAVGAGYVSRVGPIRNAVDLVWSELGFDDSAGAGSGEESSAGAQSASTGETGDSNDGGEKATEFDALPDSVVEELTEE